MPPRRGQKKAGQVSAQNLEGDEGFEDSQRPVLRGSKVTEKLVAHSGESMHEGNHEPETSLESPEVQVPENGEEDDGLYTPGTPHAAWQGDVEMNLRGEPGRQDSQEVLRDTPSRSNSIATSSPEAVVERLPAAQDARRPVNYAEEDVDEVDAPANSSDSLPEGASDAHAEKRIMGAAATLGGAAGMLIAGPMAGATLGAAAAYATTRESSVGRAARKAGAAYLQVADRAVDKGFQIADVVCDEGRRRISRHLEAVDGIAMPQPLRAGLTSLNGRLRGEAIREPPPEEREEAARLQRRYPGRVPVICEKSEYSELPQIARKQFVVPGTMLCGEFKYIVHKHVQEALREKFRAEQTVYIFVNGIALKTGTSMAELYHQLAPYGGFLHVRYGAENTLGGEALLCDLDRRSAS